MRRTTLAGMVTLAAMTAALGACSGGKGDASAIAFAPSELEARKVADRIVFDSAVIDDRAVVSPQTRDPGIEVTVSEEGTKGTFIVYKVPSEANLKGMVRGIENLLQSMNAASKSQRSWCWATRKDLFFDCQQMPPDLREKFIERFYKAVEKP